MSGYRVIEHTADIGIKVEGSSLKELFLNSAKGMVDLVVDCRIVSNSQYQSFEKISLKADIKEQLLVKWLEELLYLFEVKNNIPISFNIIDIVDTDLRAEVGIVPLDPEIHRIKYQIKAVTYHNLKIEEKKGLFKTRIIFDI